MNDISPGRRRPRTVLGLTGSIGMGKSTTAGLFAKHGVPVHDSDEAVHRLYEPGGAAAAAIGHVFPECLREDGAVDREALRTNVLADPGALRRLEDLVHPLVAGESRAFLERHAQASLVVLDIPLLFETGAEKGCDLVVVVSAPAEVQRHRVMARPGMTETAFAAILAKQMPDVEKRRRADVVIDTGRGLVHAEAEVRALITRLTQVR